MDSITNIQNIVVERTPAWLSGLILKAVAKLEEWRILLADNVFIFRSKFIFYGILFLAAFLIGRAIWRRV